MHKDNANRFWQFLTDDGTASGDPDGAQNYSSTTGYLYIQPPSDQVYAVYKLIGYINETSGLDPNDYGNLNNLTNGISLDIKSGGPTGTITNALTPITVKVNEDWAQYSGVAYVLTFAPNQTEAFTWVWNFPDDGSPVYLNGDIDECLVLTLNDNLSGMTSHTFRASGLRFSLGDDL